ncbi:MAG: L-aspartate oxidase, partial [Mycobacterium sp.]
AAHRAGAKVVVVSKARETATFYAQGGIAVVLPDSDDSIEAHVTDTVAAGGGLCDIDAVTSIVSDGYAAVAELVGAGATFDETAPGRWSVTREGGHAQRRIIHAGGDATGAEVQRALNTASSMLDVRPNHVALQVLQSGGSVAGLLVRTDDGLGVLEAPSVILATGGLGHLYGATTNPDGSTGDGVALALWAGVPVSDIEFIQFHPTMLYTGASGGRRPLITEALRGEGAILIDAHGDSVTAGVHPMGDLAPRDVVAAAVNARLAATGDDCVYLDARGVPDVESRFPTVAAACRDAGIDIAHQPIPVVPGAHYSCGGVDTDVHGRTELAGLYAAGEVARTGMHGANRLASNSLLEGLVVGGRAGRAAASYVRAADRNRLPNLDAGPRPVLSRRELQYAMTKYASVVRDARGLGRLAELLTSTTDRDMSDRRSVEDAALTVTARAVAAAAVARDESRGCHHRGDHPSADPAPAISAQVRLDGFGHVQVAQPMEVQA